MQRWLSDDTGVPFIVNFSSGRAEPGNCDGYGENVNCRRKRSHAGISKPELYLHVSMRMTLKVISVIEYQCQHFFSPTILSESCDSGLKYPFFFLSASVCHAEHTHAENKTFYN